jgi:hypothetical protein
MCLESSHQLGVAGKVRGADLILLVVVLRLRVLLPARASEIERDREVSMES